MEGNAGAAGEAGDRQAAVADEVIGRRDESGQRRVDGGARDLRQNGVEGRALKGRGRRGREYCPDRDRDGGPSRPACAPRAAGRTIAP